MGVVQQRLPTGAGGKERKGVEEHHKALKVVPYGAQTTYTDRHTQASGSFPFPIPFPFSRSLGLTKLDLQLLPARYH